MKKGLKKVMAILGATLIAGTCTACGAKPDTGEGVLDVYVHDAGYGWTWADEMLKDFTTQDWVLEKYPELASMEVKYTIGHNSTDGHVKQLLTAPGTNHYDILFGTTVDMPDDETLRADISSVYNSTVPGETVKFKEKIFPSVLSAMEYIDENDPNTPTGKYFQTPWAGGATGLYYNATLLESELGITKAPRTTDEFFEICDAYSDPANDKFAIIDFKKIPYWTYLFTQWWGQYDGPTMYASFWRGQIEGQITNKIFELKGRLESAKVLEKALEYNKYLNPQSLDTGFVAQQTNFFRGKALFMANGDWLEHEMEVKGVTAEDTIKLMKTPIISSLGEKYGLTDAKLREVVDAIDAGETSVDGVTSKAFKAIKEARGVTFSLGSNHISFLPSYAREKDIAKDFLLYMATDRAQSIYLKETGSFLPFKYDVENVDPDTYAELSASQKDLVKYLNTMATYLPVEDAFPLFRFGGVRPFSYGNEFQVGFTMQNKPYTAQKLYDDTLVHWTDQTWQTTATKAGLLK